jgi:hypothetical protein
VKENREKGWEEREVKGNEGGRTRKNVQQKKWSSQLFLSVLSVSSTFPSNLEGKESVGPAFLSPRFHATKQGSILYRRYLILCPQNKIEKS